MKQIKRKPTTPGEMLNLEFMQPLGLTQKQLALHLDVDIKVINRIINGRTRITPEMAIKIAAAFETTAEFWINAQCAVDLYRLKNLGLSIQPISRKIA